HDSRHSIPVSLFLFNDPAPTQIYTLSLHDALPISHLLVVFLPLPQKLPHPLRGLRLPQPPDRARRRTPTPRIHPPPAKPPHHRPDRKSTRLNSSHSQISYAVFCLKKKTKK